VFVLVGAAGNDASGNALDEEAVALVTCDLAWSSLMVERQIAKRVAHLSLQRPAGKKIPLGADRIWVMANHTHAGVGHLWPYENYVGPLSSRLKGYDLNVVNFVAERVGNAIVSAYEGREEARVAWGHKAFYGLGFNRSLSAYERNRAPLPTPNCIGASNTNLSAAEAALDPCLTMLRIDAVRKQANVPLGAFVTFGVHNNVVANDNELYHGDLFAFARPQATARIGSDVVVGIANGIEGDVSPHKLMAAPREARRLGHRLGDAVVDLWKDLSDEMSDPARSRAVIRAGYRDLILPKAFVDATHTLCEQPVLGAASGGGSEDSPTVLRLLIHNNPGVRARREDACHGAKLGIQAPLGKFEAGTDYPATVPIAFALIGDGVVATVPAEVTTVAGLTMKRAVLRGAHLPPSTPIALTGLTGAYIQYVTTADEYPLQRYEGASTLYGPASAQFLANHLECLARQVMGGSCAPALLAGHGDLDAPIGPEVAASDQELFDCGGDPDHNERAVSCATVGKARVDRIHVHARAVQTRDGEQAYEVQWLGQELGQGHVENHELVEVRVERKTAPGTWELVDSDAGVRIAVRALPPQFEQWAATWRPRIPKRRCRDAVGARECRGAKKQRTDQQGCHTLHRFVIVGDHTLTSEFTLNCSDDANDIDVLEATVGGHH
jgi:hypothetical protein